VSNSLKDNLFPVLSVMTGVAVAVLCTGWMERLEKPDPEVQAAIDKFDQLEPGQQGRLLTQAAGFESKDAEYKERIISIHKAVADDPSLESKLRTLHEWWRPLDATQEAKIRSYDGHSAEWVNKVERAYVESRAVNDVIVVWMLGPPPSQGGRRSVDFTESQFELFLESIIPENTPSELDSKLSGFEPDESCEITLTKIIWIMKQLRPPFGQSGRSPQPKGPPKGIFDLSQSSHLQQLFDADEWKLLSETTVRGRNNDEPNGSEDARRRQSGVLVISCIWSGLNHYRHVFMEKHLGDRNGDLRTLLENDDNLVDVFQQGDRSMQVALMKMDPSRAADSLKMERLKMERERVNAEDTAVAGLINDLTELQRRWSFGGRGGMGRGPSYGGRGGYGRPDRDDNRGSGRKRNEGRGGSRSGGGGPPRDGRPQFR